MNDSWRALFFFYSPLDAKPTSKQLSTIFNPKQTEYITVARIVGLFNSHLTVDGDMCIGYLHEGHLIMSYGTQRAFCPEDDTGRGLDQTLDPQASVFNFANNLREYVKSWMAGVR